MAKQKGRLRKWLKENGKEALGEVLDSFGENTSIPIVSGFIEGIGESLKGDKNLSSESKAELKELIELNLKEQELLNQDRADARNREIEIAKTGKSDWMMPVTGLVALGAFVLIICAVIWIPSVQENSLAIHLLGVIEGITLPIFFYYYGSSKGSKEKTELLGNKK